MATDNSSTLLDDTSSVSVHSEKQTHNKPPSVAHHIVGFPLALNVRNYSDEGDAYTRSLLLKGHGYPLWLPRGAHPDTHDHVKIGTQIGDVGVIQDDGAFRFFFNIFLPPDHPIQTKRVPKEFQPIDPPDSSEIHVQPNYFAPGTIIASDGIEVKHGAEPFHLTFKSKAREGGVLLLRDGASREDLVNTDRLHQYIQRHARYWYQVINEGPNYPKVANGTLMLVTGCDKSKEWANAGFSNSYSSISLRNFEFRYKWRPEYDRPWTDGHLFACNWYEPLLENHYGVSFPPGDSTKNQCVFARTLRISLSSNCWMRTMPYIPRYTLYACYVLGKRSLIQHLVDKIAARLKLVYKESYFVDEMLGHRGRQLFHPNFILAQILLTQYPHAQMCFIEDSCWSSMVRGGLGTYKNMLDLTRRVLDAYSVEDQQGCLILRPSKTSATRKNIPKMVITYAGRHPRAKDKPPRNF